MASVELSRRVGKAVTHPALWWRSPNVLRSGLQGAVRETPKVIQRSVPVLGAIVDADIHPTRRARRGLVPARRVVPASVEKLDPAAPPFTQPTAERDPSDRQRVLDRASARWVVWMLFHGGPQSASSAGETTRRARKRWRPPQAATSSLTPNRDLRPGISGAGNPRNTACVRRVGWSAAGRFGKPAPCVL